MQSSNTFRLAIVAGTAAFLIYCVDNVMPSDGFARDGGIADARAQDSQDCGACAVEVPEVVFDGDLVTTPTGMYNQCAGPTWDISAYRTVVVQARSSTPANREIWGKLAHGVVEQVKMLKDEWREPGWVIDTRYGTKLFLGHSETSDGECESWPATVVGYKHR
jgi:hypothetical protein